MTRTVEARCANGHVTHVSATEEYGRLWLSPDYCQARAGDGARCLADLEVSDEHPDTSGLEPDPEEA